MFKGKQRIIRTAYTCLLTFLGTQSKIQLYKGLGLLGKLFYNIKKYSKAIETTNKQLAKTNI